MGERETGHFASFNSAARPAWMTLIFADFSPRPWDTPPITRRRDSACGASLRICASFAFLRPPGKSGPPGRPPVSTWLLVQVGQKVLVEIAHHADRHSGLHPELCRRDGGLRIFCAHFSAAAPSSSSAGPPANSRRRMPPSAWTLGHVLEQHLEPFGAAKTGDDRFPDRPYLPEPAPGSESCTRFPVPYQRLDRDRFAELGAQVAQICLDAASVAEEKPRHEAEDRRYRSRRLRGCAAPRRRRARGDLERPSAAEWQAGLGDARHQALREAWPPPVRR